MMMKLKRILSLCIVVALLTGGLFTLSSCKSDDQANGGAVSRGSSFVEAFSKMLGLNKGDGGSGKISSDGKVFSFDSINAVHVATEMPEGNRLPVVGDQETLLKLLLDRGVLYDNSGWADEKYGMDAMEQEAGVSRNASGAGAPMPGSASAEADMPIAQEAPAALADDSGGHSQTNEQVEGVSEGDVVKTDGRYIYAMAPYGNTLRIIRANGASLEVVSTIYTDVWGAEFYLIGEDRLVIVGNEYVPIQPLPGVAFDEPSARIAPDYGWHSNNFTVLAIYDISDRSAPFEARKISMEGWAVSTRVIGNVVYMVTNKHIWSIPFDQADSPIVMPYVRDTAEGEYMEPIGLDRIYYIPGTTDASYLLVGAVDVYSDDAFEPEAYLGAGSNLYMSMNAMYVSKERWEYIEQSDPATPTVDRWAPMGGMKTDILRFAISGTSVAYTGMGTVDGTPINQYSMDEYNGYFRIASADWERGTFVSVLRASDMQTVGRTEPLAPGEWMQSMRFMGNMGYIVTFLNVDPLFTVDLSDPYNPKMLGELKIPGFSQYLHPLGEGLLLGIGRDTQELYTRDSRGVETVVGFRDSGMKLSVFDVSNPFDPLEIDVLLLGDGWAEVSHNPRALMFDSSRNLFGFTIESWDSRGNWTNGASVFRVENGRLSLAATLTLDGYVGVYGSRLCYIGNTLYFVHEAGIDAYDYSTFAKLGSLRF